MVDLFTPPTKEDIVERRKQRLEAYRVPFFKILAKLKPPLNQGEEVLLYAKLIDSRSECYITNEPIFQTPEEPLVDLGGGNFAVIRSLKEEVDKVRPAPWSCIGSVYSIGSPYYILQDYYPINEQPIPPAN